MWNELKGRIELQISPQIPRTDILNFMALLEQHFQEEEIAEQIEKKESKKKK